MCGIYGRRLQGHWVQPAPGLPLPARTHQRPSDRPRRTPLGVLVAGAHGVEKVVDGCELRSGPDVADAGQLAAHLRARDALIICGPDTVAVEDTIRYYDAEPDTRSTDEILANGQLVLPLATMSHQSASRRRESVSAIKAESRQHKTPIEIHAKRE